MKVKSQHPYFPGNAYTSPGKLKEITPRVCSSLRFNLKFLGLVMKNRKAALQGRYDTEAWAASSLEVMQMIESCGGRFHITGLGNLAATDPPAVFISNHMSTLETMVFPCIIAPVMDTTFVVKDSLVRHPLFGPVMRSRQPVVVGRKDPRADFQTVMQQGQAILKKGRSIVIFPQSTRRQEFLPSGFNTLGIKLAKASGVQVVPVAIRTDFWGNGKLIRDLGPIYPSKPIHMAFGKPFRVVGSGKEEHLQVIEYISSHLNAWYAQD